MSQPLLTVEGLRKAYPGVVANDNVGFTVGAGEVHALLGENGAGKSTLVKMVYGLVRPDEGRMTFGGQTPEGAALAEAIADVGADQLDATVADLAEAQAEREMLLFSDAALPDEGIDLKDHMARIEIALIRAALERAGGVVAHAAQFLGWLHHAQPD